VRYVYRHTVQAYEITECNPVRGYITINRPLQPKVEINRTGFAVNQPNVGGYWVIPPVGPSYYMDSVSFNRDFKSA
jgi:hypothetical protein